jgi:hypothetical protein
VCTRDWPLNRARYAAIAIRIIGGVVLTIVPERAGPAADVSITHVWKNAATLSTPASLSAANEDVRS